MPANLPFTPGNTIAITVAATTATVTLPNGTKGGDQVLIQSLAGNAIAYAVFGASTVTAVAPTGTASTAFAILPGSSRIFTVPANATSIATIGTANNTLYVTQGDGQ